MSLLIGTSEGLFVVDQAGAPVAGAGLTGCSVHTVRRANGSILAGAANGVYRSDDAGQSWQASGCAGEDVWALAASTANPDLVFAGVHPAGVFRSNDAGRSWAPIPSLRGVPGFENWRLPGDPNGSRALAIVLDETRPEHLWVGVEVGGIVETSDGGATWMFTLAGRNPDIHGLARDPARPDVLYAATGYGRLDPNDPMEPAGVYRSEDGGESWQYAWPDADRRWTRPMCIDGRAPHALTVASCPNFQSSQHSPDGAQSVIYQSTDGATTWRSLGDAAHAPSAVNITAITVAPERAGSVVVGMENGEVWQVSPEAEWTLMASDLPPIQALLALD
jgi:photosystem II stability/assembly factor-like uncharacterized protein